MPTRLIVAYALIGALVALLAFLLVRARVKAKLTRRENSRPLQIRLKE